MFRWEVITRYLINRWLHLNTGLYKITWYVWNHYHYIKTSFSLRTKKSIRFYNIHTQNKEYKELDKFLKLPQERKKYNLRTVEGIHNKILISSRHHSSSTPTPPYIVSQIRYWLALVNSNSIERWRPGQRGVEKLWRGEFVKRVERLTRRTRRNET